MMPPRTALFTRAVAAFACAFAIEGCVSWAPVTTENRRASIRFVPGSGNAVWREGAGWEVPRRGGWGAPEEVRAQAMRAFEAGAYADALAGFEAAKAQVRSGDPSFAGVSFAIAECRYHLGQYDAAVEDYRRVLREGRPGEAALRRSQERIYAIALDYLAGRAGTGLLFSFLPVKGSSYGVELLVGEEPGEEGLISEYPYLDFADDALVEVAKHYFDRRDYAEAERFFRRVSAEYPGCDQHEFATFQLAVSIYRQVRGPDYEFEPMARAERSFSKYLREYPQGRHAEESRRSLRELAELQAASYLNRAKFYLRESRIEAAKIYLRAVLDRYTATEAAKEAREISGRLERTEMANT
ncbi:MAG: outer membrane protein assembly factor BamD [Planctomycetota bacterium]